MGGSKFSQSKPKVQWVPFEFMLAAGRGLGYGGLLKYAPQNWRKGIDCMELAGSCIRHLMAWCSGEDFDDGEDGSTLHHLDLFAAEACMLVATVRGRPDLVNRGFDSETFVFDSKKVEEAQERYENVLNPQNKVSEAEILGAQEEIIQWESKPINSWQEFVVEYESD